MENDNNNKNTNNNNNDNNASEEGQKLESIVSDLLVHEISYEDSQELYRKWALDNSYDELVQNPSTYTAPLVCRNQMVKLFTKPEIPLVLDIGAGTGITGELLRDKGFKNLHALEPLNEFVELARKKSVYDKIFAELIGGGSVLKCQNDTYDAVIATGAFGPGHIPYDALNEVVRILKPGGYFVNCMRQSYLWDVHDYKEKMVPLMSQFEDGGKWQKVTWEPYSNHFMGHQGQLMVFQKC